VFLWPSFTYQPGQMLKTMIGGRVWRKAKPLDPKDKLHVDLDDGYEKRAGDSDREKLDRLQEATARKR
jgi:hypothetical protein